MLKNFKKEIKILEKRQDQIVELLATTKNKNTYSDLLNQYNIIINRLQVITSNNNEFNY
jgi:hypothetical protein